MTTARAVTTATGDMAFQGMDLSSLATGREGDLIGRVWPKRVKRESRFTLADLAYGAAKVTDNISQLAAFLIREGTPSDEPVSLATYKDDPRHPEIWVQRKDGRRARYRNTGGRIELNQHGMNGQRRHRNGAESA